MKTKLHPEVLKFFKEQGTVLDSGFNDEMYLYYPFWIKTLPDGKVEIIDWDGIPGNLKELITDKRNIKPDNHE